MLSLTTNVQIYLCTAPTDMRKSYDGLSALVASAMNQDVLSGHLFLFLNRRRDRIKLLWYREAAMKIVRFLEGFMIGGLVGAAVATLFAPASGPELRGRMQGEAERPTVPPTQH